MKIIIEFEINKFTDEFKISVGSSESVTLSDALRLFAACTDTFTDELSQQMGIKGLDFNKSLPDEITSFAENFKIWDLPNQKN